MLIVEMAEQLDDGEGLSKTVSSVKDANDRTALHFAAREGQTEVCKYLLEEMKHDVNVKDADGMYKLYSQFSYCNSLNWRFLFMFLKLIVEFLRKITVV